MAGFSESYLYNTLGILLALCLGAITYFKWIYTYWQRKNIPSTPPTIPFGNMKDMFMVKKHLGIILQEMYAEAKSKGHRHFGAYIVARPVYVPVDPDIIKHIMLKDFGHFVDRRSYYNEKDDPLSAHLFSIEGDKWKNLRQKLTPTFTTGQLKYMFSTLADCGKNLEEHLEQHEKEPLDIKDILCRFTTDIIASCAFGIDCNTLQTPDSEFRKYGKLFFEPTIGETLKELTLIAFPSSILHFFRIKAIKSDVAKFFMKVVKDIVRYREQNDVHRKDFMDLLIRLKNKGTLDDGVHTNTIKEKHGTTTLTLNELAAQSLIFYVAGFETSSTTMNFALFELAQNEDIQDKVREEIRTVLERHDGKITYDAMMEMQYLANVVDETLRKYPPGALLDRVCTKEYKIPDTNTVLEKGIQVMIPVFALHRDPEYYPNPDVFDPDRFTPENKKLRPPCTYLPFGDGPRNCIGLRFGLLQAKVGLACLLKNYKFVLNSKTQLPLVIDSASAILSPKNCVWLNAIRLNN